MKNSRLHPFSLLFFTASFPWGCTSDPKIPEGQIPFDREQWAMKTGPIYTYPDQMVDAVLHSDTLRTFGRGELLKWLGKPDREEKGHLYYTVVENRLGFRTLNQKSIVIKLRADQTVEWIKLARIAMENKLFKKLNYRKPWSILALNYPESFESELEPMEEHGIIHRNLKDAGEVLDFVIAFGKTQKEVEELTRAVGPRLGEDAVFWFCYPKQTSKKYTCDFNRDTGWEVMAEFHLEPVRQVAIDEDWSGLRFRHVDKIARITRQESFALTRKGKERSRKK